MMRRVMTGGKVTKARRRKSESEDHVRPSCWLNEPPFYRAAHVPRAVEGNSALRGGKFRTPAAASVATTMEQRRAQSLRSVRAQSVGACSGFPQQRPCRAAVSAPATRQRSLRFLL